MPDQRADDHAARNVRIGERRAGDEELIPVDAPEANLFRADPFPIPGQVDRDDELPAIESELARIGEHRAVRGRLFLDRVRGFLLIRRDQPEEASLARDADIAIGMLAVEIVSLPAGDVLGEERLQLPASFSISFAMLNPWS